MPYKDPKVRKHKAAEYSRAHYEKNIEEVKKRAADKKRQLRTQWSTFKSTLKCTRCGEDHPATLDFHHVDPTQKEFAISSLVRNHQYKKALEETKKCLVLCANCHRKHHYQEKKNPAL